MVGFFKKTIKPRQMNSFKMTSVIQIYSVLNLR